MYRNTGQKKASSHSLVFTRDTHNRDREEYGFLLDPPVEGTVKIIGQNSRVQVQSLGIHRTTSFKYTSCLTNDNNSKNEDW